MKKVFAILISVLMMFSFVSCDGGKEKIENTPKEEIRAIWISVYDMAEFRGISEGGFRAKCKNMFSKISAWGFRDVFLQVRAGSDALYASDIFPWSRYISDEEGVSPGYDPLKIFVNIAHENKIKLHAWINPYRISSTSSDVENLSDDNPARKMLIQNEGDVYIGNGGMYYNPSSEKVKKLVIDGIAEIMENYDVDGIHIDDYFYPTVNEEIDKKEYEEYKLSYGEIQLNEFRINQVNDFVKRMYTCVKERNRNAVVSISPSGDIDADFNIHYADIETWLNEDGYCDWVIPQIYFGMKNETLPFKDTVNRWLSLGENQNRKLIIGLASYKCGEIDTYAGKGKDEWITNSNVLSEQIKFLRKKECDGFSFFSYSSFNVPNPQMEKELENLKEII